MNSRSRIEIFPDELFLELFSYIAPLDLYRSWLNLNNRLRSITRSVKISFDLFENSSDVVETLNFFCSQTVYIHFHTSCPSLNLKNFFNLRTLTIDVILSREQLESIRPENLPFLKRLTFSSLLPDNEPLTDLLLTRRLNTNESRWIDVYHLPRLPVFLVKLSSKLDHLQSLIIDRATTPDIETILSYLNFLRHLKVTVVPKPIEKGRSTMKNTDPHYFHRSLVNLNITMNTCDKLDEFFPILSRLISLKSLYVACDGLIFNDFQQLAFELHTRVPWLKRFNCSFQQTYVDDMMKLHSLTPFFHRMRCRKVEWPGGWHYYRITTMHR